MLYENLRNTLTELAAALLLRGSAWDDASLPARIGDVLHNNAIAGDARTLISEIAFILCVGLVAFIAFVARQKRALQAKQAVAVPAAVPEAAEAVGNQPVGMLRARWDAILKHLDSNREGDWKLAVLEADKLVEDALARAGFPGDSFGDRLTNIQPGTLQSLDGIWWAHKVRNRVAHEIDYFLRYTEAKQVLGYFETALVELNFL
ncbi:MAG: hypothetical protein IT406_01945 [Candidatus Yanofskybacteria bacterium]|nr:hypothetical protein [Candidatus Yanofskybacteria bacterium]